MEVVNSIYGIDVVPRHMKDRKWYRWYRFPLLPIFNYRPADEMNAADILFSWLNIRIWTLMSPGLGLNVCIEGEGAFVSLNLPYLKIVIWLLIFPLKWHMKFWRLGKRSRE